MPLSVAKASVLLSVDFQKSRRNSLLKRKKKSGANMKLKTLGIKVVDDTFKVSNDDRE